MFDYPTLSKIAAQDKEIPIILCELFDLARSYYPKLSRFSVVLSGDNKASNYFVSDHLCPNEKQDCSEQEITNRSALFKMYSKPNVRVIDDLTSVPPTKRLAQLIEFGHKSSYTTPINHRGIHIGFIFINASSCGFFNEYNAQRDIAFFTQLVTNLLVLQYENQKHFQSSLAVALNMGHSRDPETKEHLTRMGRYSELLARILSGTKGDITHQFIHRIRLYAPFHDIGKYRVPDHVLFSSKVFSDEDRKIMNNHTLHGEEIINDVVNLSDNHSITTEEVQFIKNIIRHHHERFDGQGLPDALNKNRIPLEARIVTLADVFDALLSKRAYKHAWSVSQVMEYIETQNGLLFDPDCVAALRDNFESFMDIRKELSDSGEAFCSPMA
ncbi:HD domain-containing phosphohydrolase [Vibrio sp. 99-70-13A1]|uniref:HD-GYP domain-containing protein n=1 Tax=Vibrio sp. 99-70-13A1 TaxID=2607601 RepID=UPI0020A25F56|nr:HD domain-containing phosphohydrolase [Vibrio sp. 99-70-13A1]